MSIPSSNNLSDYNYSVWLEDDSNSSMDISSPESSPVKQVDSPVSSCANSPTKAKKRRFEDSFSSPESSPTKRPRINERVQKSAKRTLELELQALQPKQYQVDEVALEDKELNDRRQEVEHDISTLFAKTMQSKDLLKIRFSQTSISDMTKDGIDLDDLIDTLAQKGWDKGKAALTVIKMPDGKLTSLDNRRLYCIQKCVAEKRPRLEVPVHIYSYQAMAKETYLKEISMQVKTSKNNENLKEHAFPNESWGYCIWTRMRVFNKQALDASDYGFTTLPEVKE